MAYAGWEGKKDLDLETFTVGYMEAFFYLCNKIIFGSAMLS